MVTRKCTICGRVVRVPNCLSTRPRVSCSPTCSSALRAAARGRRLALKQIRHALNRSPDLVSYWSYGRSSGNDPVLCASELFHSVRTQFWVGP